MTNVIHLDLQTRAEISAGDMLHNIAETQPENAFVIIWPNDGGDITYHSSVADAGAVTLALNIFLHKLYAGDFS